MSHESYESKPDKPSTAAIVGGSVTMFFGAVITPFFFPVGVPLLVIGGALVASGSGVKINDKVKEIKRRNEQEKKEETKKSSTNVMQQSFCYDNYDYYYQDHTPYEDSTPTQKTVDFNSKKLMVRKFDVVEIPVAPAPMAEKQENRINK